MSKLEKYRNWAFILYPESMPSNAFDLVSSLHIPAFISPCHDSDINDDGTPKKPHYHCLLMFDGVQSSDAVLKLLEPLAINYVYHPPVLSAYARYLCHLDEKEKALYKPSDLLELSGADYSKYLNSEKDYNNMAVAVIDYIACAPVTSFRQWLACCRGNPDWLNFTIKNTYFIKAAIDSIRFD